jgi:16S rRNA (adenine1518-N6/adenine1519-N6)-dimethyltransferase
VAVESHALMVAIVRAAFGQRRKMLHNALQTISGRFALSSGAWKSVLATAAVDGRVRGETLDVATFAAIANAAAGELAHGATERTRPVSA